MTKKELWAAYDKRCGIIRDENGRAKEIEAVDRWWNTDGPFDMLIYRLGDNLYCASGWNGESFLHSFLVRDRFTAADDGKEYELVPIHRYEDEGRDPDEERDEDYEIVGFSVC